MLTHSCCRHGKWQAKKAEGFFIKSIYEACCSTISSISCHEVVIIWSFHAATISIDESHVDFRASKWKDTGTLKEKLLVRYSSWLSFFGVHTIAGKITQGRYSDFWGRKSRIVINARLTVHMRKL